MNGGAVIGVLIAQRVIDSGDLSLEQSLAIIGFSLIFLIGLFFIVRRYDK